MNSHDRKTILKMIEHCDHIQEYTAECCTMEDFEKNTMMVEACVFNLVQLGELAHTELSDETKQSLSHIPWRQIYGMRNRIVHGYADVRLNVVWETVKNDISGFKSELERSVAE
jgi:uncharacterized protein with HEPN domain